jgi:hypothetical protein
MRHSGLTHKPTGTERVATRIEADIRAGVLAAGGRLLPRRRLCEQFGVSGAVIDAAYRRLEAKRLITRRRGSGVTVAATVRPPASQLIGVLTTYGRGDIEDYFEPLLAVAGERRTLPMLAAVQDGRGWKRAVADLLAHRPHAVLVDVEARNIPLNELRDVLAAVPVCFVHRWEWVPERPERAVLADHAGEMIQGIKELWLRGNDRLLLVNHHRTPQPHVANTMAAARTAIGFREDDPRMAVVSGEEIEAAPADIQRRVAAFAPTGVWGASDFLLARLDELCPQTANLDRIGCFDTQFSRQRGRVFSSFRTDFETIWRKALESFAGEPRVDVVPPALIRRWNPARIS